MPEKPKTEKIWNVETFVDDFGRKISRMKSIAWRPSEVGEAELRYVGSAILQTPQGQAMIQFEIKVNTVREAFEKYDECGEAQVTSIKQKMTGIVVPGQGAVDNILRLPPR